MGLVGENKLLILLVFLFFFLIYVSSSSGHFDPWDGIEYYFITESIVLRHSLQLYPDLPTLYMLSSGSVPTFVFPNSCHTCEGVEQPTYIVRSLLSPFIAVPFYYASFIFSASPTVVIALFVNPLLISLTCVIVFCFSLDLYKSRKIAFILAMIFGVCSFIWPYNSSLMSEPSKTLCIFSSVYFIYLISRQSKTGTISSSVRDGNYFSKKVSSGITIENRRRGLILSGLAALLLGLSVISHPSSIIFIPGFLVYFIAAIRNRKDRKAILIIFLVVLLITLLLVGLTNYVRFGSFTKFGPGGYEEASSLSVHRGWQGLVGLLVSPGRGLIFYFPMAILMPLSVFYMYSKNKGVFFVVIYTVVVSWFFYGTLYFPNSVLSHSDTWSGGWWGPRYLVPILPFITLTFGTLLKPLRRNFKFLLLPAIVVLSVAGFCVNLLGILIWWQFANVYGSYDLGEDPQEVKTWNPGESFIVQHIEALLSDYVSQVRPANFSYTIYSLAPCSYDNYIYCKYGILPVAAMGASIIILSAVLILMITRGYSRNSTSNISKLCVPFS